jgi:hypothetical protein
MPLTVEDLGICEQCAVPKRPQKLQINTAQYPGRVRNIVAKLEGYKRSEITAAFGLVYQMPQINANFVLLCPT